jgi:hypothetical protein
MAHALGLALQGRFNDRLAHGLIVQRLSPPSWGDLPDRPDALLVSLTTVIDVATRENWSRYVMFRDLFSSSNVRRKYFISAETEGMADRSTELCALNMMGSEKWHET